MISGLMALIAGFPDSGSQTGGTWLAGPAESIHLVKSSFSPVPSLGQIGFQPSHLT